MPRMKFTYQKSAQRPFLSFISYLLGLGYALFAMASLGSLISGFNLITGNRWLDLLIYIAGAIICVLLQAVVNNYISAPNHPVSTTAPLSSSTNIPPEDKVQELTQNEKPHKKANRYCKYCGSLVDLSTKKCTGCGKQYFNLKSKFVHVKKIIFICSVLMNIFLIILGVYIYNLYIGEHNALEASDKTITELTTHLEEVQHKLWENEEQVNLYLWDHSKAEFLDKHVVFITENSSKCHKYDCKYIAGRDTYYLFLEDALAEGYVACPHCYNY